MLRLNAGGILMKIAVIGAMEEEVELLKRMQ